MSEKKTATETSAFDKLEQAVTPAPAVTLTQDQFSQILATIAAQRDSGLTVSALTEVMRVAREPIPEVKVHHGISHYRPEVEPGQAAKPPQFRWPEIRWGVTDKHGKLHPIHEIDWDRSTADEIAALNALKPCQGEIRLTDGSMQAVRVVEELDEAGKIKRLVIAFPYGFFSDPVKRNYIGQVPQFCAQLAALPAA